MQFIEKYFLVEQRISVIPHEATYGELFSWILPDIPLSMMNQYWSR